MSALGEIDATLRVMFRLAEEADLPALEWMGLYAPHRGIIREVFDAQLRGESFMLLGLASGFPVAQAWIVLGGDRRVEETATLGAVRVFPPLRGAGIGHHLMAQADELLAGRGVRKVELLAERSNAQALRFYARLGWRALGPEVEVVRYATPWGEEREETLELLRLAKDLSPSSGPGA
jgi:GNAT superfamily N-acetyltransferase